MIKIVTDTVASIPEDMVDESVLEVLPMYINYKGMEHSDLDMDLDAFYADIYDMIDDLPTSSQPSQQTLEDTFESIASEGNELLGIFVSTYLSGTYEGAVNAARAVKERFPDFVFSLIDSASCAFDEAWPVLDGVACAKAGGTLDDCVAAVLKGIRSSRFVFEVENLSFLQKGGRIGNATALLGNLIHLSPVLTVIDGKADTVAKIRSRKKALQRIMQEFKADVESYGLKSVVVHYIGDKAPAMQWAKEMIEPLVGKAVRVIPVSPVIGMHVGPAVGIAYECDRPMAHKFRGAMPSLVCSS